jgi:hypothetical protein
VLPFTCSGFVHCAGKLRLVIENSRFIRLILRPQVVMSTKNVLGRPWVEFVLGIDQVIKVRLASAHPVSASLMRGAWCSTGQGFDRALPLMSVGERSTVIMSPEYACKSLPLFVY